MSTKQRRRKTPYWWGVLERGVRRLRKGQTPFTGKHYRLAGNWVTCACGRQDARIPRVGFGMPADRQLANLGVTFCAAISSGSVLTGPFRTTGVRSQRHVEKARGVLQQIELRAAQILRERGKRG